MKRFASQLTFCSPDNILRNMVVEVNEAGTITAITNMLDQGVESTHTEFYDGILSPEFLSVKCNMDKQHDRTETDHYQYFDLSEKLISETIPKTERPLVLDFGSNNTEEINHKLKQLSAVLISFSIFEIIASCVYYPALMLGLNATLHPNRKTQLLLWKNVDLINKKLTSTSQIIALKN